jgi:hypothetical protein
MYPASRQEAFDRIWIRFIRDREDPVVNRAGLPCYLNEEGRVDAIGMLCSKGDASYLAGSVKGWHELTTARPEYACVQKLNDILGHHFIEAIQKAYDDSLLPIPESGFTEQFRRSLTTVAYEFGLAIPT